MPQGLWLSQQLVGSAWISWQHQQSIETYLAGGRCDLCLACCGLPGKLALQQLCLLLGIPHRHLLRPQPVDPIPGT